MSQPEVTLQLRVPGLKVTSCNWAASTVLRASHPVVEAGSFQASQSASRSGSLAVIALAVITPLFLVLFRTHGLYEARRMDSRLGEAAAVIRATAMGVLAERAGDDRGEGPMS